MTDGLTSLKHVVINSYYEPKPDVPLKIRLQDKSELELSELQIHGADEYDSLIGGGHVTRNYLAKKTKIIR